MVFYQGEFQTAFILLTDEDRIPSWVQWRYGKELRQAQEGEETGYYNAMGEWTAISNPLSTADDYISMHAASPTEEELAQFVIDQKAEFYQYLEK